ncbi:two-component system, OmpR family, osmolarity sensor histidine kinase EnvZ [Bartonella sp. JB63]|nr:two-component system, OmpR family, osmolarity sensor histidine kinase EnvZ [Bartonella sp. JB15]AQX28889.1 two-component system, OmpR family, osmolarity sensor histidine kinase EnvZ [Bartonella sp. JB63]
MIEPAKKIARWLSKKMPKRLYARSLIIIIAPMVLLQTVIGYVFMERHWQMVTERLSTTVVHDIAAIIDIIETYPQQHNYEDIKRIAQKRMGLNISILPPDSLPPQDLNHFLPFLITF